LTILGHKSYYSKYTKRFSNDDMNQNGRLCICFTNALLLLSHWFLCKTKIKNNFEHDPNTYSLFTYFHMSNANAHFPKPRVINLSITVDEIYIFNC